jgi:hypothetical protein
MLGYTLGAWARAPSSPSTIFGFGHFLGSKMLTLVVTLVEISQHVFILSGRGLVHGWST